MQGAHEPQADFRGSKQDADEGESQADDPSSVAGRSARLDWKVGLGEEGGSLDLHVDMGTLAFHLKCQNTNCND